ncbi:MAG: M23 family metallopeptidase [Candidatus Korobacteraceae bacterium]
MYGHLSRIDVHEGDTVKQGQVMGVSGQTGMAGGDHIHFAMQLDQLLLGNGNRPRHAASAIAVLYPG